MDAAEVEAQELREAVRQDDRSRVAALLERTPALAEAGSHQGLSLAVDARLRGHLAIVARLSSARRRRGAPPLSADELIALGDNKRLAALLQRDRDALRRPAADGFLPSHRAAYLGESACLELLLDHGADARAVAANASALTAYDSAVAGHRSAVVARLTTRAALRI